MDKEITPEEVNIVDWINFDAARLAEISRILEVIKNAWANDRV